MITFLLRALLDVDNARSIHLIARILIYHLLLRYRYQLILKLGLLYEWSIGFIASRCGNWITNGDLIFVVESVVRFNHLWDEENTNMSLSFLIY